MLGMNTLGLGSIEVFFLGLSPLDSFKILN